MFNVSKSYAAFRMIYHFYLKIKFEKAEKAVAKLYDKIGYVVHIRTLKQALSHGLILKKMHRCIKFKRKARLKLYIKINTELKRKYFKSDFFKLMNNASFWITKENITNLSGLKVITTKARIGAKYHATNIYFQLMY